MNCPVCVTTRLETTGLESNLSSMKCEKCGGNWIQGSQYWSWLAGRGEDLPERPGAMDGLELSETPELKMCPECKSLMIKYRVGHDTGFSLDQCAACKGIWFDKNEWQALKAKRLHDNINAVFTASWQAEVVREETRKRLEQIYTRKFGAEDYAEIRRVRAWLDGHEKKQELLAYLTDRNPLSV